ncbi:hypothetical protein D1609_17950 [Leptospira borgpetersenii serovar Hardjo-bovis]|nr:hypothetical protein D1609_17950 [Leptospira borgpetersenii serovar Hardjo-bovis]
MEIPKELERKARSRAILIYEIRERFAQTFLYRIHDKLKESMSLVEKFFKKPQKIPKTRI